MTVQLDDETEAQLSQCVNLLYDVLANDLLGVYLYGSAIVGGLQKYSDIDLFVVTARPTTYTEKKHLVAKLLNISGVYKKTLKRPIEMTIVDQSAINPWHYPPLFDFQYGDWLRKKFTDGDIEPWPTKEMPDLALLITQVLLKHRTLFGPKPDELLSNIPYQDFIRAITAALNDLMADLNHDTGNVLLTLARILSTVTTDQIRSKPDAAIWVIHQLPDIYKPVIILAKAICTGEKNDSWEAVSAFILPCATLMRDQIQQQLTVLQKTGYANRFISYAEPTENYPQ